MESAITAEEENNLSFKLCPAFLTLLSQLKQLREAGKYCDVILHIGDKTLMAHKIVLAAWSPFFQSGLNDVDEKPEHIDVACENHEDAFFQLVEFIYSGHATVNENNIGRVLSLADQLKIEPLKRFCEDFLKSHIHIKNFITVFRLGRCFQLKSVQEFLASFVQTNLSESTKQPEYMAMSAEWLLAFLSSEAMATLKPEYTVYLIVGWISMDFENREKYLQFFLSKVNFTELSSEFLLEVSKTDNFFTLNHSCLFLLLDAINKADLTLGPYNEAFITLREKYRISCLKKQVEKIADLPEDEAITAIYLSSRKQNEEGYDSDAKEDSALQEEFQCHSSSSSVHEEELDVEVRVQRSSYGTQTPLLRSTRRKGIPVKRYSKEDLSPIEEKSLRNFKKENMQRRKPAAKLKRKPGTVKEGVVRKRGRPKKIKSEPQKDMKERNTWRRCDFKDCNFTSTVMDEMENHMSTEHGREATHSCNICEFRSSYSLIYFAHMRQHFEGPPFACDHDDCQYKTERIQPFLTHRMIHTNEMPFKCSFCDSKFRCRSYLQNHERSHTGERPFQCEVCQKSFSTKGTLDQHSRTHTQLRPFLCDTCGFSTKYQSHLIAHKRIHSGDVFRCKYPGCSYSTPKRGQIRAHLRAHLGIRAHSCPTCRESFVERSHLIRHEKIHQQEKYYKCETCDYSSHRKDKLKEHIIRHHCEINGGKPASVKASRPRRRKDLIHIPQETDNARELLEDLVQSSTPAKYQTKKDKTVDEDKMADSIRLIEEEKKRVADLMHVEKRKRRTQRAIPPGLGASVLKNNSARQGEVIQHQLDSLKFHNVPIERVTGQNDGLNSMETSTMGDYEQLTQHINQSLLQFQSAPHVSVRIVPGENHLSEQAMALAQSVAESVVLNTHPVSQSSQTTSLNNVTITTLEYTV